MSIIVLKLKTQTLIYTPMDSYFWWDQLSRTHGSDQKLMRQLKSLCVSTLNPLHIYYGHWLGILGGLLTVDVGVSLGLFFCEIALPSMLYLVVLCSADACSFLRRNSGGWGWVEGSWEGTTRSGGGTGSFGQDVLYVRR